MGGPGERRERSGNLLRLAGRRRSTLRKLLGALLQLFLQLLLRFLLLILGGFGINRWPIVALGELGERNRNAENLMVRGKALKHEALPLLHPGDQVSRR